MLHPKFPEKFNINYMYGKTLVTLISMIIVKTCESKSISTANGVIPFVIYADDLYFGY